jgi:hypothetical protein
MPELAPVTIATLLMGMLLCNAWIVNKLAANSSLHCLVCERHTLLAAR